jgi:hypothetical protein
VPVKGLEVGSKFLNAVFEEHWTPPALSSSGSGACGPWSG